MKNSEKLVYIQFLHLTILIVIIFENLYFMTQLICGGM